MTALQPEDVAVIVVLYRPDTETVFNLASYAGEAGRVFAVDNSELPDPTIVSALNAIPSVTHISMDGNAGIGRALNVGVAHAGEAGFGWVLTMDQDSTPGHQMLFELSRCAETCGDGRSVGTVSPLLRLENGPAVSGFEGCRDALTTITSGSLLSVAAWSAIGGFDEDLFIDQVDHEFCLRLNMGGFAVLECGSAWLRHSMGEMRRRRLLGPVFVTNHSALRRYYITRNRYAVSARYRTRFPEFRSREMSAQRHELLKMLLLEDHRFAKLLMVWRGYRDFRRGRTGPYPGASAGGGS
jgi:rhamnosyltransferase